MKEADGHRVHAGRSQFFDDGAQVLFVERLQDLTGVKDTLLDFKAEVARHQRVGPPYAPVVQVRPVLAAYVENVPEPLGGDQGRARAFPLQDGVDGHRGPVDEEGDLRGRDSKPPDELLESKGDAGGLVGRGGWRFRELQPVTVHIVQGQVGEGPADVHSKAVAHVFSAAPVFRGSG